MVVKRDFYPRNLPAGKTKPGFRAGIGFTRPAPKPNGAEGYKVSMPNPLAIIGSPRLSCRIAVVDIAEAIIDGVQEGLFCLIRAAMPAI